jgi:hypothetical protein
LKEFAPLVSHSHRAEAAEAMKRGIAEDMKVAVVGMGDTQKESEDRL